MQAAFLFDQHSSDRASDLGAVNAPTHSTSPAATAAEVSDEAEVHRLQATGRFRVLRRLKPRPIRSDAPKPDGDLLRLGIIVDTETTGLDPMSDEIVELAALAFTYDSSGIRDVVGTFEGLRQPSRPMSAEAVRLTGLTDEALAGNAINAASLEAFVRPASLIVAHNAAFDRSFAVRAWPFFSGSPWACSFVDVDWKRLGTDGAKLGHLLGSIGIFHDAHRALWDCHALLEVLAAPRYAGADGAFAQIVRASSAEMFEIRAEGSPFSARDVLKSAGYRWDRGGPGRKKSWFKIVNSSQVSSEVHFCRYEIFRDTAVPVVRKLRAADRLRR
ncbi:3'-5' exonuclease [Mangrovibrevibacter kandeliae]|uniref:3'-5' exonuclease n=1 Tax=Mangrovibrevibacter kandeliae TaxID=2968473 RepID=UPI0021196739|nr:3'-5' exonuclease [Aurantimonas sp. CSK15Z-1]MCQ8781558.1 3'-5' exonuclease [Aurantimonas sp. CSK15Z-1]